MLMHLSDVGKRPPLFCEASFLAQEILDSDFQFDMGDMIFNYFRCDLFCLSCELRLMQISQ